MKSGPGYRSASSSVQQPGRERRRVAKMLTGMRQLR